MNFFKEWGRFMMAGAAAHARWEINISNTIFRDKKRLFLLALLTVPVVVVSNQSGLARGYFPASLLDEVNKRMEKQLAAEGAHIDGLYICPHHPEAKKEKYRKACNCRKPKIGLLKQAAADLNLNLTRSYMVGDRWSDLKCGAAAGATSILVLTGYGRGDQQYIGPQQEIQPAMVAENLNAAVDWILEQLEA